MSEHLVPENCYICGDAEDQHEGDVSHTFWSNADAEWRFAYEPDADSDVEAHYIETYRPY